MRTERSILILAMLAICCVSLSRPACSQSHSDEPNVTYDENAEHELLQLANQSRAQSQLAPLKMEDCLIAAARRHAVEMAEHNDLSHQLAGEPELAQRLATTCPLHLDQVAENIAFSGTAAEAHDGFMHSPGHRANLLGASYNVVGMGVVKSGSSLYIVEDFGHSLPDYSLPQAAEVVAKSVARARTAVRLPAIEQRTDNAAQSEACELARADSLRSKSAGRLGQLRYVLRFSTMDPGVLPPEGAKAVDDRAVTAFAVGVCFARSASYPSGAYWVVLVLY